MAYDNTFKRAEVKYLLDVKKYSALIKAVSGYMTKDSYGVHTICNIYFDSDDSVLVRSSLEKPVYKEKLRLRTYGAASDESAAFLEIKKKYNGIVYKRRVEMKYKEAIKYIDGGSVPIEAPQELNEIDYMIRHYGLKPKIVICYDRLAMYGNDDKEFRLTFDGNIRSRTDELDLRLGDYGEPLDGQPFKVMEIKTAGAMPLWMTNILTDLRVYPSSFSKYGSIYCSKIIKNGSCDVCSQVS